MIARSLFMDRAFEANEAQQTLEALGGIRRIIPDVVMFLFRIE
jgi:hypothetical protein